jgi:glutathione S-transferase
LAPAGEAGRLWTHQLQLTVTDLVAEVHDTHHPISSDLYYRDQRKEARERAAHFRKSRMPKFLGYFEDVLDRNPRGERYLVGSRLSYADLSLFQIVEGLRYAFPKAMRRLEKKIPKVVALHDRVVKRPRIAAYVASKRRIPFNEDGIFRRYPALDG